MGWLCSECGTENRLDAARCRACRRRGSVCERAEGLFVTAYERCISDRPRAFSEGVFTQISRGVGGANRVVGIAMRLAVVFGILLMLYMSRGVIRSGELMARLNGRGEAAAQLIEGAQIRIVRLCEQTGEQCIDGAAQLGERLGQLGRSAEQIGSKVGADLMRGGQRISDQTALIARELPLIDLHVTAWTLNALYGLRDFLANSDSELLNVLADGVQLLCDGVIQLRQWQWLLRE